MLLGAPVSPAHDRPCSGHESQAQSHQLRSPPPPALVLLLPPPPPRRLVARAWLGRAGRCIHPSTHSFAGSPHPLDWIAACERAGAEAQGPLRARARARLPRHPRCLPHICLSAAPPRPVSRTIRSPSPIPPGCLPFPIPSQPLSLSLSLSSLRRSAPSRHLSHSLPPSLLLFSLHAPQKPSRPSRDLAAHAGHTLSRPLVNHLHLGRPRSLCRSINRLRPTRPHTQALQAASCLPAGRPRHSLTLPTTTNSLIHKEAPPTTTPRRPHTPPHTPYHPPPHILTHTPTPVPTPHRRSPDCPPARCTSK
ncbi:hypothetical protein DFH27DRAFT_186867 [Peziza echinospora]|nr:hypothetical protein DFH27DRAFT_186867 [Peziza echinospora]